MYKKYSRLSIQFFLLSYQAIITSTVRIYSHIRLPFGDDFLFSIVRLIALQNYFSYNLITSGQWVAIVPVKMWSYSLECEGIYTSSDVWTSSEICASLKAGEIWLKELSKSIIARAFKRLLIEIFTYTEKQTWVCVDFSALKYKIKINDWPALSRTYP